MGNLAATHDVTPKQADKSEIRAGQDNGQDGEGKTQEGTHTRQDREGGKGKREGRHPAVSEVPSELGVTRS